MVCIPSQDHKFKNEDGNKNFFKDMCQPVMAGNPNNCLFVIIIKDDDKTEKSRNDMSPKPILHTLGNFIKVLVNSTLYNSGSCLSILCGPPFIWH